MGFVKLGIFWWILKGTGTCHSLPDHIRIDPSGRIKTHQDPQLPSIINEVQLSTKFLKIFRIDFKLLSQFASYLGSIVTSDENVGHFSTDNLEGYKKNP